MKTLIFMTLAVAMSACLPQQLQKYRNGGKSAGVEPQDPMLAPSKDRAPASASKAGASPQRATIYAIDKQTYRFQIKDNEVWDSLLNVLLRNYNLTIVDRQSGIITTEWDSYYLKNEVFRNRVSVRLNRSSYSSVDVTMHNNVEKLRDAAQAAGTVGAVWLPAEDQAGEIARIVQNVALVLNQPPPVLPPNTAVAKGGDTEPVEEQDIKY
jgi:hypothetical protein